jgi:hypothetical protein
MRSKLLLEASCSAVDALAVSLAVCSLVLSACEWKSARRVFKWLSLTLLTHVNGRDLNFVTQCSCTHLQARGANYYWHPTSQGFTAVCFFQVAGPIQVSSSCVRSLDPSFLRPHKEVLHATTPWRLPTHTHTHTHTQTHIDIHQYMQVTLTTCCWFKTQPQVSTRRDQYSLATCPIWLAVGLWIPWRFEGVCRFDLTLYSDWGLSIGVVAVRYIIYYVH